MASHSEALVAPVNTQSDHNWVKKQHTCVAVQKPQSGFAAKTSDVLTNLPLEAEAEDMCSNHVSSKHQLLAASS